MRPALPIVLLLFPDSDIATARRCIGGSRVHLGERLRSKKLAYFCDVCINAHSKTLANGFPEADELLDATMDATGSSHDKSVFLAA